MRDNLLICCSTIWLASSMPALSDVVVEFRVANAHGVGSSTEFNRFEKALNEMLKKSSIPACKEISVNIVHIGSFAATDIPNGEVKTQILRHSLLGQVDRAGGNVLLVGQLGECGGTVNSSYAGCASNGSLIALELLPRHGDKINGLLLLHEFGHVVGLARAVDGSTHASANDRLMYYKVGGESILEKECQIFHNLPRRYQPEEGASVLNEESSDVVQIQLLEPNINPLDERYEVSETEPPQLGDPILENLLSGVYPEGVPTNLGIEKDTEVLNSISNILTDPSLDQYRANAAEILKIYGNASHIKPLIDSLAIQREAVLPEFVFRDHAATLEAVGEITQRTSSPEGERFLFELALTLGDLAEINQKSYQMDWIFQNPPENSGVVLGDSVLQALQGIDSVLETENIRTLGVLEEGALRVEERLGNYGDRQSLFEPMAIDNYNERLEQPY